MHEHSHDSSFACGTRPIATLLMRLEHVREVAPGRWRAKCPAHEGHRPSLAITETVDGTVLMHCFHGCATADVVAAIGLDLADLFPSDWRHDEPDRHRGHRVKHPFIAAQVLPGLTVELLEVAIIIGAIQRRGLVTDSEHARLQRSLARILEAERLCHD
jgi:hypothetical protein